MTSSWDVIVVGAGLAGASAARELTARGRSVLLLERFAVGHAHGSSHGTSRIFRRAYADPFYVGLTGRAEEAWQQMEAESARSLRRHTGGLDTGDRRDPAELAALLRDAGVTAEILQAGDVAERWPGLLTDGPAVFHADAGYLDADATLRTLVDLAVAGGAELREGEIVEHIESGGDGVRVQTASGSWTAPTAVVAAGAWLPTLGLDVALPPITVKQQEVFHFPFREPGSIWPTIVHKGDDQLYALPSGADGGLRPAFKVAQFDSVSETTADGRDGVIDERARKVVVDHVERWMPGLEAVPSAEQSCLFTMTSDEDFVIDRAGPVVVASPCSGHGAKFAPLIGGLVADVVAGRAPVPRFVFRT